MSLSHFEMVLLSILVSLEFRQALYRTSLPYNYNLPISRQLEYFLPLTQMNSQPKFGSVYTPIRWCSFFKAPVPQQPDKLPSTRKSKPIVGKQGRLEYSRWEQDWGEKIGGIWFRGQIFVCTSLVHVRMKIMMLGADDTSSYIKSLSLLETLY